MWFNIHIFWTYKALWAKWDRQEGTLLTPRFASDPTGSPKVSWNRENSKILWIQNVSRNRENSKIHWTFSVFRNLPFFAKFPTQKLRKKLMLPKEIDFFKEKKTKNIYFWKNKFLRIFFFWEFFGKWPGTGKQQNPLWSKNVTDSRGEPTDLLDV